MGLRQQKQIERCKAFAGQALALTEALLAKTREREQRRRVTAHQEGIAEDIERLLARQFGFAPVPGILDIRPVLLEKVVIVMQGLSPLVFSLAKRYSRCDAIPVRRR